MLAHIPSQKNDTQKGETDHSGLQAMVKNLNFILREMEEQWKHFSMKWHELMDVTVSWMTLK